MGMMVLSTEQKQSKNDNKVLALFLKKTLWSGDTETQHELTLFACNFVNLRASADNL